MEQIALFNELLTVKLSLKKFNRKYQLIDK